MHGIFVAGDRSGSGKSTMAILILDALMKRCGISPDRLAYIKPCTQCQDVTLVEKFCESQGIPHRGLGPVRFVHGFTYEALDGDPAKSAENLLKEIESAVLEMANLPSNAGEQRFVVVDGVGYPAVGSCCGISNAQVAARLNLPVLLVGKPGVGDAIDSLNLNLAFFEKFGVIVRAVVFNKLKVANTEEEAIEKGIRHPLNVCSKYVTKYIKRELPHVEILGFVPESKALTDYNLKRGGKVCLIDQARAELLQLIDEESSVLQEILEIGRLHLDADVVLSIFSSFE